jgi:hypothetical protein
LHHDPEREADRREFRRKGGKARKRATVPSEGEDFRLESVADVVALLGKSINETRKGVIDVKVANAVGYLGTVLLRALESADLEERLARLEEMMKEMGNGEAKRPAGQAGANGYRTAP